MKILITGGSGFIGAEIVNMLYSMGKCEIIVLDAMSEQIHGKNWRQSYLYKKIEGKCKFIKGSVCDLDTVKNVIPDCEIVIHLAAETGTGQSMYQINQYNLTNVMGTSNLFQAISLAGRESKVKKIILSSSRSVYGEGKYECPNCGVLYPDRRNKENRETLTSIVLSVGRRCHYFLLLKIRQSSQHHCTLIQSMLRK